MPEEEKLEEQPAVSKPEKLPVCKCGFPVEQVRFLDYGEIRVVFHSGMGCVLGCTNVPKEELDKQV